MAQKILVVDDDPVILKWVKTLLKGKGYKVAVVETGQAALESIKKDAPDLIILDIILPDMDGYQVCNKIRASAEYGNVPIIFLTVRDKELNDQIIQRLNIVYIQKPANGQVLLEKIEQLLTQH